MRIIVLIVLASAIFVVLAGAGLIMSQSICRMDANGNPQLKTMRVCTP